MRECLPVRSDGHEWKEGKISDWVIDEELIFVFLRKWAESPNYFSPMATPWV